MLPIHHDIDTQQINESTAIKTTVTGCNRQLGTSELRLSHNIEHASLRFHLVPTQTKYIHTILLNFDYLFLYMNQFTVFFCLIMTYSWLLGE